MCRCLPAPVRPSHCGENKYKEGITHLLVVHVGQDPCYQLNEEDHQQQAEILEARREGSHRGGSGLGGQLAPQNP